MEDIRLGRDLDSGVRQVPMLAATLTLLASADPKRTRLIFGADPANNLMVGPSGTTLSATQGFAVPPQDPILILRIEEWGRMITWDWFGFSAGGAMVVSVAVQTLQKE